MPEPVNTSRAFVGAYRKGQKAADEGEPRSAMPYTDKRNNYRNGNTFSRAFMRIWYEGWDDATAESKE